jgi:tetratricopeptide (TPR) repeat protein
MDINKSIQRAIESYQSGNLQEAEYICREILKIQPYTAEALHLIGIIYHRLGNYDLAGEYIKKALSFDPTNAEAYYNLGNAYKEKNLLDDAIICFQKATQLRPNLDLAYDNIAILFKQKGNFSEAITSYKKALRLNLNYIEAYFNLGNFLKEYNFPENALSCYKRALQFKSKLLNLYDNLGSILQMTGQLNESLDYYEKALITNPLTIDEYKRLGVVLQEKRIDEDITNYRNSQTPILIVVDAFNRRKMTQLSLTQTRKYKTSYCHLQVYNDHSTEYDNSFLSPYADEVIQLPNKMGSHNLRFYQFKNFLETNYDFLYLTDSDVIHDPDYIGVLLALYDIGNKKLPVCLYNSKDHSNENNILDYRNGIFLRKTAPGVSMFYDRKMVEKIVSVSDKVHNEHADYNWDYRAIAYLGLPWITPETSYLEHYGGGGIHSTDYETDRAINPTKYVQERREAILKYLIQDIEIEIIL